MKSKVSAAGQIWFLIPLLALLAAFPPLSTDMYLPAIPYLGKLWSVDLKTVNLTLICFFLSYSPALLVYGPISDRFGRKIPLLAGLALFILGSLLCATAGSVQALIYARVLQGMGAAAPSALGLSITKDHYTGPERYKILAIIGIIVGLAPMIGPTLGSWALLFGDWHLIFVLQAGVALVSFVGVLKIPETNATLRHIPLTQMAGPYVSLFKNSRFLSLTLLFAVSMCSFFAFIAASSEIYINGFGVSAQSFGLYFGINALSLMTGSFLCMKLVMRVTDRVLLGFGFSCMVVGGLLLMALPHSQVWFFTLPMCCISFGFGLTRPLCVNMILETVNEDIGSASSLMMFANFIFGALAMGLISLCGEWKIMMIGATAVSTSLLTLTAILAIGHQKDKISTRA
jgi:DHA1 family bicyclomycin/chloramphenicol resistance-like MFS transporter